MKRSRRSEYGKKRNSSKKNSEQKFQFSKTAPKKSTPTIDRLKSFEIDENQEKKYRNRKVKPKKKSGCFNYQLPLGVVIVIFIVKLISGVVRITDEPKTWKDDPIMLEVERKSKASLQNIIGKNTTFLLVGPRPMKEVFQLKKDSLFPVIPYVNIHLYKGFHLYDASLLLTSQLFAKFSKYYFFYDRVKKSSYQSMTNQWTEIRGKLAGRIEGTNFSHEETKNYHFKELQIAEKEFKITASGLELHGLATLVEDKTHRYFFHFISKEKEGTYFNAPFLKKYLNYYLKIQ
ncbi:hypothetical protein KORDIASMS9_02000 [Kordia sp. SMS9]|uniref:hypothetical protein n=1 Tax=Kordia sp. SMS9 TaxID=2282170 RepID=UPI000E0E0888|nr:hypothetical protein [Kordia sp. SMS9]AXG69773.1 hypothetical protein KORDIASMS9_02000 [Kordia sp. SMS9]